MTGGSTIVEFWRDEPIATETQAQSDDILLLKQAVLDIDETAADDRPTELWVKRLGIALLVVALGWIGFAIWSMAASGAWRGGPGAWADAIATIAVPLILLGLLYMLLVRSSRTESRRYMETARALRTEADLLELRLGRIAAQLESARQTMQDQAELLDSYGAAASSNMEASAELIASRAQVTADRAEAAERAGAALIARMDALVASIPALEERSARMAAQIMDNGHALGERIDTLEARLHALTEMSDEARARTLAATKSLTSQLSQLQEATRATTDEVSGMADIAANRIEATAAGARQMMDRSRSDLEAQSSALAALIDAAQAGVASSSESVRAALVRDLDSAQADMDSRLDGLLHKARETVASIDDSLTRRADSLQALVAAAQAGIGSSSGDALATLSRDMDQIENDLRARLGAALDQAQEALALSDGRLSRQSEALTALITRSREHLDAIGSDTVAGLTDAIGDVEGRLHQINDMVEGQRTLIASLHSGLQDSVSTTEARFEALEQAALARNQRLTQALEQLTAETRRIDEALSAGGATAEKLIGSAETLLVALDSSVRELDETYPAALTRFDARLEQSRARRKWNGWKPFPKRWSAAPRKPRRCCAARGAASPNGWKARRAGWRPIATSSIDCGPRSTPRIRMRTASPKAPAPCSSPRCCASRTRPNRRRSAPGRRWAARFPKRPSNWRRRASKRSKASSATRSPPRLLRSPMSPMKRSRPRIRRPSG